MRMGFVCGGGVGDENFLKVVDCGDGCTKLKTSDLQA